VVKGLDAYRERNLATVRRAHKVWVMKAGAVVVDRTGGQPAK
jgi:hypothetical protein